MFTCSCFNLFTYHISLQASLENEQNIAEMSEITQILRSLEPALSPFLDQLKPFVKLIPKEVTDFGYRLYSKPVFDEVVLNLNFFDNELYVKQFITTSLSLAIVGFGGLTKFPQIFSILKNQSANGLSFLSLTLDIMAQLITVAYNFRKENPFSSFGETALVAIQNILILLLVMAYGNGDGSGSIFIGILSYAVYALFSSPGAGSFGVFTNDQVHELFKLAIPLAIFAKLPQIINNFKQGSTGQLSLASVGASVLGNLVRIGTLLNERGITDTSVIAALISGGLNLVLLLQILILGSDKEKKTFPADKKNK